MKATAQLVKALKDSAGTIEGTDAGAALVCQAQHRPSIKSKSKKPDGSGKKAEEELPDVTDADIEAALPQGLMVKGGHVSPLGGGYITEHGIVGEVSNLASVLLMCVEWCVR